jgi:multidrug transporter EmrE-like cation transporter
VPGPSKQAPPPLQVDTARVVLIGIGVWTVALVVLLLLGDRVDRMWTWTCLAAVALGVLGLWIMKLQGQVSRRDRD